MWKVRHPSHGRAIQRRPSFINAAAAAAFAAQKGKRIARVTRADPRRRARRPSLPAIYIYIYIYLSRLSRRWLRRAVKVPGKPGAYDVDVPTSALPVEFAPKALVAATVPAQDPPAAEPQPLLNRKERRRLAGAGTILQNNKYASE